MTRRKITSLLQEEPSLSLGEFHGRGARLIVVHHAVDPRTALAGYRGGFKRSDAALHVFHARIKPQVIGIWIKNDWHAVVDLRMLSERRSPA